MGQTPKRPFSPDLSTGALGQKRAFSAVRTEKPERSRKECASVTAGTAARDIRERGASTDRFRQWRLAEHWHVLTLRCESGEIRDLAGQVQLWPNRVYKRVGDHTRDVGLRYCRATGKPTVCARFRRE